MRDREAEDYWKPQIEIMKKLRHKSFQSSQKYVYNIPFKEKDFETTVATSPEEIQKLGQAGWQKYD